MIEPVGDVAGVLALDAGMPAVAVPAAADMPAVVEPPVVPVVAELVGVLAVGVELADYSVAADYLLCYPASAFLSLQCSWCNGHSRFDPATCQSLASLRYKLSNPSEDTRQQFLQVFQRKLRGAIPCALVLGPSAYPSKIRW